MVARHDIDWLAPDPLWTRDRLSATTGDNGAFNRPAILRFKNDAFMEELMDTLGFEPERLGEWLALPETWREPQRDVQLAASIGRREPRAMLAQELNALARSVAPATTAPEPEPDPVDRSTMPFKLYQPAQQRFYVLAASLVCRTPGLPDRRVDAGKQEQVSFVVRRVLGPESDADTAPAETAQREEYAYVATANGFAWQRLDSEERNTVVADEERLPMFGVDFDSAGYRRHLFGALIPVGRREAYAAAALPPRPDEEPVPTVGAPVSAVGSLFTSDVAAPWRNLIEHADVVEDTLVASPIASVDSNAEQRAREAARTLTSTLVSAQTASWYLLLDLALFLERYAPTVWTALQDNGTLPAGTPERLLLDHLRGADLTTELRDTLSERIGGGGELGIHSGYVVASSLGDALVRAVAAREDLDAAQLDLDLAAAPDHWPDFLFPLAHPGVQIRLDEDPQTINRMSNQRGAYPGPTGASDSLDDMLDQVDLLVDLVEALTIPEGVPVPDITPEPARLDTREAWYVLRCVYERPNCGPFESVVVSRATQPFRMASFFDPDAPQREIRIPMPLDVSTGGLRKYQKNARVIMSDLFCGKVSKIRKMTFADLVLSVLPWPFHKDLPSVGPAGPCDKGDGSFGLIFSLSIPIVTLCAMILLIIMVALFDMFFRWIPYLFVAIPIPGLRAKAETNP